MTDRIRLLALLVDQGQRWSKQDTSSARCLLCSYVLLILIQILVRVVLRSLLAVATMTAADGWACGFEVLWLV